MAATAMAAPAMTPAQRAAAAEQAYLAACRLELQALKPGNAHVRAAGHRMTVAELETSAQVSAAPLCRPGLPVGQRVLAAVTATRAAVGSNTNLGIVLLAAPLVAAAEKPSTADFRHDVTEVLVGLTVEDAAAAYAAIRLAAPAGLGAAPHEDVASAPTVTLRDAMTLAADRDRVARQYATGYEDVFSIGLPRLLSARRAQQPPDWGATCAFMAFLAAFPDSHIQRKHGLATAEAVRAEAAALVRDFGRDLGRGPADERLMATLLGFDRRLKADGLNPGTSADLTVASLLALACSEMGRGA